MFVRLLVRTRGTLTRDKRTHTCMRYTYVYLYVIHVHILVTDHLLVIIGDKAQRGRRWRRGSQRRRADRGGQHVFMYAYAHV